MDGVERVMVLGILAVIVAILSFAWSATDDPAPVGATDGGATTESIPLSSSSRSVVIPPPIDDRVNNPDLVQRRRAKIHDTFLGRSGTSERDTGAPVGARWPTTGEDPRDVVDAAGGKQPRLKSGFEGPLPTGRQAHNAAFPTAPGEEEGTDEPTYRVHVVQEGETLWRIAYREVGPGDTKAMIGLIQRLNPTIDASRLPIGLELKIPVSAPAKLQTKSAPERAAEGEGRLYTVQKGDTLGDIARRELGSGRRWMEIYKLNKGTIQDPERIHPGLTLFLPES